MAKPQSTPSSSPDSGSETNQTQNLQVVPTMDSVLEFPDSDPDAQPQTPPQNPQPNQPDQPNPPQPSKKKKLPPWLRKAKIPNDPIAKALNLLSNPETGLACGYLFRPPHKPEHQKHFSRVPSSLKDGIVMDPFNSRPMAYQDPKTLRFYPTVAAPLSSAWDTFLTNLATACKLCGLYTYQNSYAYYDYKEKKLQFLPSSTALSSWIRSRIRVWDMGEQDTPTPTITSLMKDDEARIFSSQDFRSQLPLITRINSISLPRWGEKGEVIWPKDGYDSSTGIYTTQECKPDAFLMRHPKAAAKFLKSLFGEFQFLKPEVDFSAALCQLLSTYAADLMVQYDEQGRRREPISPLIASTANDSGAGKTLLLQLMSLPTFGPIELTTLPNNEHHRRQELLTAIKEGKQGIILDETRSTVSSTLLALITSDFTGRLLGVNESVGGRLKIAMAGPQMELDGQTSRRTIMSKLFTLTGPNGREIKRPMDTSNHHRYRPHLLAISYHLVKNWADKGCPLHTLTTRNDWPVFAQIVGGILEANGFTVPFYERSGTALLTDSDPQQALLEYVKGLAEATFAYPGGENFENVGLAPELLLSTMKKLGFCENIPMDSRGLVSFAKYLATYANLPRPIHGYLLKKRRMRSGNIYWLTPADDPASLPRHVLKKDPTDGKFERDE